ncbi:MAG TPA: TonB-dependent receptor [Allosphingosinicella sp.]|nr:TonB-dependent receptor [Allosphingosinicella sp.]
MVRTSRVALLAGLSSLALIAGPALAQGTAAAEELAAAQDEAAAEADTQPAPDSTIVITGTRRTDRTVADSPVPVDVIGSEAIVNSGQTETNKILNQLVPSFNFPQPSIADGSDALRPATLRGLSPDQTLVLINGKRRHVSALLNINGTVGRGSAAVDMNLIPGLAIGRVEVLRDGAAAQYGSDAIAGVINIQLKNSSSGGRASVTWGKYFTTINNVANVTGLQLNGSGQPQLDPADGRYLLANTNGDRDADDGRQLTIGANIGIPMGPNGYFNVTGEFRDRNRTNRAGFDLRPNYNRPAPPAFDSREAGFDRLQFRFGDPDSVDYNLFVNAGMEISENWELYAFGSYGHRDTVSAANYRQAGAVQNRDFSVLAPSQAPNAANFASLTADGFLPLIDTDLDDMAGTLGLRTTLAGWKADLSFGHGQNSFDYIVRNSINTSFGPQSQRVFDAGGLFYAQDIANLDFSRQFPIGGFAKPLSIALGGEYRKEHFEIRPGELQSYATGPFFRPAITGTTLANCTAQQGRFTPATNLCDFPGRAAPAGAQGFPGIPATSATDVGRHSWAAYVELDTDPIEGVTTTIAGRYEHFSDFGSTWNGKFAARWEPVEGFAIRGSISNGFRAPSLHQQFFSTTSTNFINGVPVDIATLPVSAPAALALGARDLKPEKSLNMSFGATANPLRGLTVTADLYQIDIDDRIVLTETLGRGGTGNTDAVQFAVTNLLAASGFPQVAAARFFINGLDTRTRGIDVVAVYRRNLESLGNWSLSAAYNYNKTRIDQRLAALGPLAAIPGLVLFGRVEGLRFTDGQPRDKIVLSADGDIGNFGITARTTRYGKVVSPGAAAPLADPLSLTAFGPDDIFLKAKWITDLELRYKAFDRLELAIGANNLFDVYPTRSPFGARPAGVGGVFPANQQYIPFSIFSPFGFNGRFVYGRVGIEF